jgi:predicted metal-dependent hydrolase
MRKPRGIHRTGTPFMTVPIYTLIRSGRKSIALVVTPDARLVVRAPFRAPLSAILAFAREKSDWISAKQEAARLRMREAASRAFVEGEKVPFLGAEHPLKFHSGPGGLLFLDGAFHLKEGDRPRARELFQAWYKAQARSILEARVARFAAVLNLRYQRVRLTAARSRWGSCSSRGSLSFSWRLILAPPEILDYVVIHELIHLRVKNHSKAFWDQVRVLAPDCRESRRWLRTHGHRLDV